MSEDMKMVLMRMTLVPFLGDAVVHFHNQTAQSNEKPDTNLNNDDIEA